MTKIVITVKKHKSLTYLHRKWLEYIYNDQGQFDFVFAVLSKLLVRLMMLLRVNESSRTVKRVV